MTDGGNAPVRSRRIRRWGRPALPHFLVYLSVVVLNLLQQPGRITFDTKLDMQLNPADLLERSAVLWNADWALGGLQNQASGYLFPMGPAFLVGEVLGVPTWIWQRLWSAAVMLLAYEGARRLAANWPGIGSVGAMLAGLTYMLSPRVLTTVGGLSGETLPGSVLPWTLLALVLYLRGRLSAWVAFVLSAATIPCMGGQNATLVVACLVLPALLLAFASGRPWARRLADLVAWGALVCVGTLWWLVPLVLLGSYGPPFLDFIESANSTAGATGWLSSLRGTSHWVAYFSDGGPLGWTGGYALASSRLLLVTTVLVAAIGLAGLLQPGMWQRRVLAVSVLVGLAVLTAGSGGWAGSFLSQQWLEALDSFLAPLRNIHKFDPLVRLPLSLGVGAWVTTGIRSWTWFHSPRSVKLAQRATVAVTGVLVLAAATPAGTGSLRAADGFEKVPASWRQAVGYLRDQPLPTRVLVLPGAGFGIQTWGRTVDEPIQVLDPPPWMARAQITVANAGTLRLLDSVEQSLFGAKAQQRVSEALKAMGITHVVVRNDLDPAQTDGPTPDQVRATVSNSPGAQLAAVFGREADGPAIEVYELEHDVESRVDLQDWADRAVVDGGPEVVPDLRAADLVADDQAAVLADDDGQADIVTDSLRRVERSFGRVHDARSGVMSSSDRYRVDRRAHDHVDDTMPSSMTTATYDGAAGIVASSSAGYADILGAVRPEEHPYSAFDTSIYTAWGTAPLSRPQGQWIEASFERPTPVRQVSLRFDTFAGAPVTSVRVATDDTSVVADVEPDGSVPRIDVGDASATSLRITVLGVAAQSGQVRLSDVRIAGHDVTRSLVLPGRVSSSTSVFMSSEAPRRACAVAVDDSYVGCELSRQLETSETPGFDRTIRVEESGHWRLRGSVTATHGPALDRLFAPLAAGWVSVTASSTYAGDPAVTAAGAVDGRSGTGWTSAPGDPAAALQLTWGPRRTVSSVGVTTSPGQPGDLPETVIVDGGPGTGEPQFVATTGPRAGEMRPVRTNQLRVTAFGEAGLEGVGIAELQVAGIEDLVHRPDPGTPTGAPCGFGPTIEVGGRVVQTRVSGTLRAVRSGADLDVIPCGERSVFLSPGDHRVRVLNPPGFATTILVLSPPTSARQATTPNRPTVRSWSATHREVEVSARSESVLGVAESYNRGWSASIEGVSLSPVVLDGWRQGFVLPAGSSGLAELDYDPQVTFQTALVGGLVLVGLLLLLAVFLLARGIGRVSAPPTNWPGVVETSRGSARMRRLAQLPAVLGLAIVSLPLAVGAVVGWSTRHRADLQVSAACTAVLVFSAIIALSASAVVFPPVGSDVVVALVVGVVCGRVFVRP